MPSGLTDRRAFLKGLLAAAAAPVVVPDAVEPLTYIVKGFGCLNEEIVEVISVRPVDLAAIRNELLPGLFDVRGRYDFLPRAWDTIFKIESPELTA